MTSPTTPRDDIGLSERLRGLNRCIRCDCQSCRSGFENHEHICTDGPGCVKPLEARLRKAVQIADEAATQLDAQAARVKELEAECFRLAADTCHAGYGDEYGHHRCREVDEAESRATRAEKERDEALAWINKVAPRHQRVKELVQQQTPFWKNYWQNRAEIAEQERDRIQSELDTSSIKRSAMICRNTRFETDAVVIIANLRRQLQVVQQERDEAYERAAKVADKKADDLLDAAARLGTYIGATKLAYTEADLHEQAGTAIKSLVDAIRQLAAASGPDKEKRK